MKPRKVHFVRKEYPTYWVSFCGILKSRASIPSRHTFTDVLTDVTCATCRKNYAAYSRPNLRKR